MEFIATLFAQVPTEFLFKIALASLFGAVLGIERRIRHKSTGMKTHFLICLGSMLFAHIGLELTSGTPTGDISRVLSQIVSGVGFLGAGAILKDSDRVIGLTTAALIWVSAAIGATIGLCFYVESFIMLIAVVVVIPILVWIERWIHPHEDN